MKQYLSFTSEELDEARDILVNGNKFEPVLLDIIDGKIVRTALRYDEEHILLQEINSEIVGSWNYIIIQNNEFLLN